MTAITGVNSNTGKNNTDYYKNTDGKQVASLSDDITNFFKGRDAIKGAAKANKIAEKFPDKYIVSWGKLYEKETGKEINPDSVDQDGNVKDNEQANNNTLGIG